MPLSAHCSILGKHKKHYSSMIHVGVNFNARLFDCAAAYAPQQQKTNMQILTLWSSASLTAHSTKVKIHCCDT